MKNLFFVLALFFVPSAFSAPVPVISGPFSTWYSSATAAIYENAGLSSPLRVTTGGAVSLPSSTPYTAQLNTAGAATLQTTLPVSVSPPAGSPPTAAQSSSALALAGAGGIAAGTLVADVPLGSGVGSLAANLALPALGFVAAAGGAAGMVMGSPLLLAGAAAATVGMSGYSLYQAIKGQGITVDSNGVASISSAPSVPLSDCASALASQGFFPTMSAVYGTVWDASVVGTSCYRVSRLNPACASTYGAGSCGGPFGVSTFLSNLSPVVSPPVVASDSALQSAILAALASNASIALDGANLAIKNGVDIQAAINKSGAQANTNALHLESAFSKLSSSIDSLGNTQAELARNVVDFPACANGDPSAIGNTGACAPVVSVQKVPLTNNTPQSVNTISQAPAIQTAINTATAAQQKTQTDLCEAHPDALACSNDANLSDVPLAPLTTKNLAVSLSPVVVSSIAACPAPLTIGGGKIFLFDGVCTWAAMLKPLILAFAWLCAGAVVFRGRPYA